MKLKIMSFNIGSCHKMYGHYTAENLGAVADFIRERSEGADIVCMQEVDRGALRSERVDMVDYICKNAGYDYNYFMKIRNFQGGEYGTAVISRYPICGSGTYNFPVKLAKWGTAAGWATIEICDGKTLTVFNSHLSCENEATNRETMTCYTDLLRAYYKGTGKPFIAAADFNVTHDVVEQYSQGFTMANHGLATYEDVDIDNFLSSPEIKISDVHILDTVTNGESDHRALVCDIEL